VSTPTGAEVWEAAENADLEAKARHILLTLAGRADLFSSVQISERELAAETGFSRSTVWNRLHQLEDLGWLQATRAPFRTTIWTLQIPPEPGA